jgi:hypothetical protein
LEDDSKKHNAILSSEEKIKYNIDKSKSHFALFRKTVNEVFQRVKVYPEVPGLDILMEDTKRNNS